MRQGCGLADDGALWFECADAAADEEGVAFGGGAQVADVGTGDKDGNAAQAGEQVVPFDV